MIKQKINQIILAPCISEKSTELSGISQYVFKISKRVGKKEVALAIEALYNVNVTDVRVCSMHGKKKVFRGRKGKLKSWKKAYVALSKGQTIDFSGV